MVDRVLPQSPFRRRQGVVELDGADKAARQLGHLREGNVAARDVPDVDQQGFIEAIRATDYDGPWGVEILSETYRKLPLEEMARRSFETTMAQLTRFYDKTSA